MASRRFLYGRLEEAAPKKIKLLLAKWRRNLRGTAGRHPELPFADALSPVALDPWFDNTAYSEYDAEFDDVYVLRSGPELTEMLGVDLNGRWFSEVFLGEKLSLALRPYRFAYRLRRPTYSATQIGESETICRLILPVARMDGSIAFVVAIFRDNRLAGLFARGLARAPDAREEPTFAGSGAVRARFQVLPLEDLGDLASMPLVAE